MLFDYLITTGDIEIAEKAFMKLSRRMLSGLGGGGSISDELCLSWTLGPQTQQGMRRGERYTLDRAGRDEVRMGGLG